MQPTLVPKDRVLVNKLAGNYQIGDIVVFRRPPKITDTKIDDLIKRIVALPGQTIRVANCKVYVDGKELSQPYLPDGWQNISSEYCTVWPSGYLSDPYKVPRGCYFVMGDNRQDSDDSRYWGPLPSNYIVGRAVAVVWPLSRLGSL
jgi:signal peptidase I